MLLLARMALTTQPTHWKVSAKVPNKIVIISLGFDIYLHEKDQFWPRQGPSNHGDKVLLQIRRLYKEFNTKVNSP